MPSNKERGITMNKEQMQLVANNLVSGKFVNRLIVNYKDTLLSDGQLYSLWQECCTTEDFEEIINNGLSEPLP